LQSLTKQPLKLLIASCFTQKLDEVFIVRRVVQCEDGVLNLIALLLISVEFKPCQIDDISKEELCHT
jgi:hypothetical protein